MVYSTHGLSTSASNDVTIQINVESETDDALKKIENINISGYTFNFNKDTYTYKVEIEKEQIKENNIIDTLVDIPDTFMGIPTINIIFSMIAIGITIFGYNYLIEK